MMTDYLKGQRKWLRKTGVTVGSPVMVIAEPTGTIEDESWGLPLEYVGKATTVKQIDSDRIRINHPTSESPLVWWGAPFYCLVPVEGSRY
jgi:hypothetical protein